MIDEMFFRFLSHWYDREQARAQYLQQMPEYAALLKKQDRASWPLNASLDSGGRETFLEYEAAHNALAGMAEEAAFLTGLTAGVRLCLRL